MGPRSRCTHMMTLTSWLHRRTTENQNLRAKAPVTHAFEHQMQVAALEDKITNPTEEASDQIFKASGSGDTLIQDASHMGEKIHQDVREVIYKLHPPKQAARNLMACSNPRSSPVLPGLRYLRTLSSSFSKDIHNVILFIMNRCTKLAIFISCSSGMTA